MVKKFTTVKQESFYEQMKTLAIMMFFFGIILLLFKDFPDNFTLRAVGAFFDSLILIAGGATAYFIMANKLKGLSGTFIEFGEDDRLQIRLGEVNKDLDINKDIQKIEIKLKSVEITDASDEMFIIKLDEFSDIKAIKDQFSNLKKKLHEA